MEVEERERKYFSLAFPNRSFFFCLSEWMTAHTSPCCRQEQEQERFPQIEHSTGRRKLRLRIETYRTHTEGSRGKTEEVEENALIFNSCFTIFFSLLSFLLVTLWLGQRCTSLFHHLRIIRLTSRRKGISHTQASNYRYELHIQRDRHTHSYTGSSDTSFLFFPRSPECQIKGQRKKIGKLRQEMRTGAKERSLSFLPLLRSSSLSLSLSLSPALIHGIKERYIERRGERREREIENGNQVQ